MHLVRNIEDFIEDLDRLVTYEFSEELELDDDDEETTIPQVMAHRWDTNTRTLLAANESAKPFWAYLETLLKFDATKAQAAPQEKSTIFRAGDHVTVNLTDDDNYGKTGLIVFVDQTPEATYPYQVRFSNETNWYKGADLDLGIPF